MAKRKFLLITFFVLILFNLFRVIGVKYWLKTSWYRNLLNDCLHHYQIGLLLCLVSFVIAKQKRGLSLFILALAAGMIIDELMYITLIPLGFKSFHHYHWHGISFEFASFVFYSLGISLITKGKDSI